MCSKITLQLITNAGKERQSQDLLTNLFLTPEKEKKNGNNANVPTIDVYTDEDYFVHVFWPNHKS